MNNNLRDRLRRLGVHKGAGHVVSAPRHAARFGRENMTGRDEAAILAYERAPYSAASDAPLWNIEQETAYGLARVRRTHYPLQHQHGDWSINDVLARPPHLLARLNDGSGFDPHTAVFLDTETTGLAGGAGTLVFLVGVGYFEKDDGGAESFTIDQYFLHEPAEEAAMLDALNGRMATVEAMVTFNGRSFDVPLLETRFTLSRLRSGLSGLANLDLLVPARRAWRAELESCRLSSLEYHMLGVRRDQQDIPGALIPQLYREYLLDHQPA
ncbi:MAG TPA: ribonuclease H-like domain-containing protein, partial [Anaerolineae bacterium]